MWVGDDDCLYLAIDVDHYERKISFCSIMRFDGSEAHPLAELLYSSIYDFSQEGSTLYAASYACTDIIERGCNGWAGRLYRSLDASHWYTVFDYPDCNLWELEQFEGNVCLGYDDGRLARVDPGGSFGSVWQAPNSIISMLADGHDALYFGTGAEASAGGSGSPEGRVYAWDGVSDPAPISTVLGEGIQCLYHPHTFPDIRPEHWAFEEIEGCCAGGVVGGYLEGRYGPTEFITRDQMAVFIARALTGGEENVPEPTGEPTFPDVPADYWAYKHIEYAHAFGVVQGYTTGLYGPTVRLTRDQMAVFIARALCGGEDRVPNPPCSEAPFEDVPCSYWARPHIQYILLEGVTQGYPDGGYHPKQTCTRAEMAVFMSRALKLTTGAYQNLFVDVPSTNWAALYIEALAAPLTVNTMPEGTLKALADHGEVGRDRFAVVGHHGRELLVLAGEPTDQVAVRSLRYRLQKQGLDEAGEGEGPAEGESGPGSA